MNTPPPVVPDPENDRTGPAQEDALFRVICAIDENPTTSQRALAESIGISLGKVNYCLKALFEMGLVSMEHSRSSQNKTSYSYLLTPAGMAAKASMIARSLERKTAEYEALRREIDKLKSISIEKDIGPT